MPLPPVQTLDAADKIGQIPEPDRLNVGPSGLPQAAPIPIPGTGLTQEKSFGKGFSSDYANAVLGAKPHNDPGHLQMFSGQDVYNPRYSSVLPGEDSEEAFAKAQPWYNKWANATLKMGATAIGTFWNGITAIPDTISNIKNGVGDIYKTDSGTSIDRWLQNLENQFPNYYTKWETQHPFLSALPFSGGGANFWSDKFLKNLGFTIGAIGGAALQDTMVGVATEGIGEIPLIGSQVGRAALWLNKVFTGSDRVGELLQLGRQVGRTEKQLLDLQTLARAAAATKVSNGARFAMNLYGAAASEAGFEARDGYQSIKKDLTDDYIQANGYAPTGKDLDDINSYATAGGNVRFGINLAILGLSDAIQFDSFLKPYGAAKAGYRSSIQKGLEDRIGAIALKKGSIDEFERAIPTSRLGRIWENIRPAVPAFLSEGFYEEGGQYAAEVGTKNFYERKYLYDKGLNKDLYKGDDESWDARNNINNIIHSVVSGMAGEFGTTEGWENIFLGSLTGIFSSGVERFLDRKDRAEHRSAVLNLLNSQGVTGTLKSSYDTAVKASRIAADMKQAAGKGNLFKYKNFQHEQFVNFITSGIKAGRFDLRLAQLDMLKEMSNEEFKKAFGLDKTTQNVKTVNEYVDALKEKAQAIKKSYDLIDDTFTNPYTFKKKAKNDEQALENEKHQEFESWKDELLYLTSITPDVKRRKESIAKNIRSIDGFINPTYVQQLTDRAHLSVYAKSLSDQAKVLKEGLDKKLSTNIKADRERADLLDKKVAMIERSLAKPDDSNLARDTFEDLLNFQLNGETSDTTIQIAKAAIPELINSGIDMNRLDQYKESANRAFEVLSSREGFEKYFKDVQAAKAQAERLRKAFEEQQRSIPPPPATSPVVTPSQGVVTPGQPAPAPAPVAPAPVEHTFKNDQGKEKRFEEGKQYYLSTEPGKTPELVTVVGRKSNALIVKDEKGNTTTIPLQELFAEDKLADELDTELEETSSVDDTTPPDTPQQVAPLSKRGESKKDLAWGIFATTDPPYDDKTTPDDNFQRRHQNFLFNLGSSNPLVFNQENKPHLRIIPVTAHTAEQLGLPKGWIEDKGDDANKSSIRAVYVLDKRVSPVEAEKQRKDIYRAITSSDKVSNVIKDMFAKSTEGGIDFIYDQYSSGEATLAELERGVPEDIIEKVVAYKRESGVFFTDGEGNPLSKIGESVDPKAVIYTNLATTDLYYGEQGAREERYTNKSTLDENKVMDQYRDFRKGVLDIKSVQSLPMHQFTISRGMPNETDVNTRNSIVDVGIVREKDLDVPVMEILTLGNVAVAGALNNEGEGISAHKSSVNMGDMGKPVFNFGGNMGFLDARRFTPAEGRNIFELLKVLADPRGVGKRQIFQYLNKIIHLPNTNKGGKASSSSITISGANLFLGKATTPILMDPVNLENNKDKILDFLATAFHNVNNSEILRIAKNPKANDLAFRELKAKDGQVEEGKVWKNYQHYLLSNKNPEGGKRTDMPLATKIVVPQEGEVPMIQKYSVLEGPQLDTKLAQKDITLPKETIDKLKALGWEDWKIAKMTESLANSLVTNGLTPERVAAMKAESNKEQGVTSPPPKEAPSLFTTMEDKFKKSDEEVFAEGRKERAIETTDQELKRETEQVIKNVLDSQKQVQGKTADQQFYIINGENYRRVSNVIPSTFRGDPAKYEDARIAGSTMDNIVRKFFSEGNEVKPEQISDRAFKDIITALKEIKKTIESAGEKFLTNNLVVFDQKSKIAGEIDILSVDKYGNFHIYDIKTSKDFSKYDTRYEGGLSKREQHTNQLSAYANLFFNQHGVKIDKLGVLPIEIQYDPKGYITGVNKLKGIPIKYDPNISKLIPVDGEAAPAETGEIQHDIIKIGDKNIAITNTVRDAEGNIQDFTVSGVLQEDGSIRVAKSPDGLKALILKQLKESQIKKDETTTPSAQKRNLRDRLGDKDRPAGEDSQYRMAGNIIPYQKADLEKEFAEFRKMLPNIPIEKVAYMIRTTGGGRAWGVLEKAMVKIYQDAEVGTTYHEAFEAVWGHYLTGAEQQSLYDEFKAREGSFQTYTGTTRSFANASIKEAKEQLAEEFRDYKMERRSPKTKIERFFQAIIDFIKKFLFGDPSMKMRVFEGINRGQYRGMPTSLRTADRAEYSRPGIEDLSEAEIQDTLQGMTVEMFMEMFKENQDIIAQLEENPDIAARDIYSNLKERLTNYFESEGLTGDTLEGTFAGPGGEKFRKMSAEEQEIALNTVDAVREKWSRIKGNWANFVKEHKRYLKVFNVEYVIDDEGNIAFADEDFEIAGDNKSQAQYDRDIFQIDAKNAASPKIKLLIATIADSVWKTATYNAVDAARNNETLIKRDNSLLTLPKQVQYAKLFNYMLHNLSNINGLYNMWDKMKEMVADPEKRKKIDANVQRMMVRLGLDKGFKNKTIGQMKMALSFENTMAKQKPGFFRQFIDPARKIFFKTSVLNSKLSQVKNAWTAGMRSSQMVTATNQGNFMFSEGLLGVNDPLEFLQKMGIPIENTEYQRLKGKDRNRFNSAANKIMAIVKKAAKDQRYVEVLSPRELDFNNRIDELAEIYVSNISGDDTQSQHPNLDNEQTSNFVLNNYVSTILNDAHTSETREEFMNKIDNQYFNDIFHKDSILLNEILFDKDGTKTDRVVQIGVVEGREAWNGDNKSAATLTEAERQIYEINNNLNGVFYTLLPADAKTEWAIYVGTYLSPNSFFGSDVGRRDEITKFAKQMYKWLQTEVNLARDYKSRTNVEALNRSFRGRKIGNSLRFFADILDKDVVDKIHDRVIDKDAPLETVFTEPELRSALILDASRKAEKALKNLIDWNLLGYSKDEGKITPNGFDSMFLTTHLGDASDYAESDILRVLTFREMNYILNNIEMHKFFFGDPGQYKDELKRIKSFLSGREATHVDTLQTDEGFNQVANQELNKVSKNGPQLSPGDPGYHTFKNHLNTFTIYDVEYSSAELDTMKEVLGDRVDPYDKGVEADAQAYMMDTAYREIMYKAGGRFTEAQERQFQWYMAWERQDKAKDGIYEYTDKALEKADKQLLKTPENTDVAFPILKLVHSGIQTVENRAIASLDKASWAPLFYKWYKGKNLGKLHTSMRNNGIDYARMESAHKVGIQATSSTTMYDKEGNFNQEGVDNIQSEAVPMKQIGIQVEQTKKDKGQTEGSQARKINTADFRSNGVPIDFLKGKNEEDAFAAWNLMKENEKLKASPIYQKIKRHDTALRNLTRARLDRTMNRLGITKRGDTYTIPDKAKVAQFILGELERRELPRNIAYGLDMVYTGKSRDGEFSQPLEANAQYTKIRSILYSVIEKTVMRPKVSGGQKTMLSVTGFEIGARVVKREVNGKPVYVSDTLKFYKRGEDGTEACEVMLPYWFGKQLMAMGSERTKEEVIKHLNNTEDGKKLLSGIGFRIPTQGPNSVDFFVVKDFLPEQMGDVIVLPSEITAKAGSDFDIDKLNTYLRNFYVDNSTGYPKVVQWKGSQEATNTYIDKLLDSGNVISNEMRKELDRYMEEEKDYATDLDMSDLVMRIPGVAALFEDERITKDFLGKYRDILKEKLYMQALENEYFDSIESLISSPENYSRLIAPNDASQLKGTRNYIKRLIAEREGTSEDDLGPYGKLLDSTFMMQERHAYLMSKGVVGTSAVSQTAHAVAQNIDGGMVVLDPSIKARFPHNTISGKISLSGLTINGSDQLISNVNSQTTDGGVDVAKDKFLAEMGINSDTLATYLVIRRMGAPKDWAELFINQPAIQRFLKIKAIHDSVSQINNMVEKEPQWKLNNLVYAEFGGMGKDKERLDNKPEQYSKKDMEEMIKAKTLTFAQQTLQLQMLDDFQKYNSLAWDVFHYYQGYNWDTARLNDPNDIRMKVLKFMKANNQLNTVSMVSPVGRVMENTFIGEMKQATLDLNEGLRSLINVQSGAAGSVLDDIAYDLFNQPRLTQYDRNQLMLAAELSMVDYSVQTGAQVKGKSLGSYLSPLLLGEKSTARYIQAIKDMKDVRLGNNPFLQALVAFIDKRRDWPSLVQLGERDYDTYTSNVWTDAFKELENDNTVVRINDNPNDDKTVSQIFNNLVLTAIIQSGSKKTSTSLSHLVPNKKYSEFTRDALKNMRLQGFYENGVFYRTNWNNDKLVPLVKPHYPYDFDPFYYEYPFFVGDKGKVTQMVKELTNKENPAGVLNVPGWQYKGRKYIKIRETFSPATNERYAVPLVRLFARVDVKTANGTAPLSIEDFPKNVLYKEVNTWGDGNNIQEYHEGNNQSLLPSNRKVEEFTDDLLVYALEKSGYKTNAADDTISAIFQDMDKNGPDEDEDTDTYTPDDDTPPGEPPVAPSILQGDIPAKEDIDREEEGRIIERGGLPMLPENIRKIKSGEKTITNRTADMEDGIYTLPDGTTVNIEILGRAKVDLSAGLVRIKGFEDWELDKFAKAEGFRDWADFSANNKFSKNFITGAQGRYIYSVSPTGDPSLEPEENIEECNPKFSIKTKE